MASFLHNTKIGVPIIDSIPHCHIENALKRGKNQEMWLRCYIEDKVGVCIIDSIIHTAFQVWNTIDDTYSNFVLYIVTKPHFLIFASFQSIFSMAVWNTIDDRYSNFCFMQKRIQIFLFFAILESIFNMTVWNTIDDRFSNFVLPLYRNEATFLDFRLF